MKFFKVLDTKEAKKIVKDNIEAAALKVTSRKTSDAVGYTVSDDVFSTEKYPPYNRSTVDGYAVFSGDVACAGSSVPSVMKITGRLRIGEKPGVCVKSGDCVAIPTGGVVPDGANAVVMIEDVEVLNDEIAVYRPVKPWENVIRCGEELDKGSIVMNRGGVITPVAAGALAGLGIWRVDVFDGIKISVISTGDELVDVSSDASDGKIRDVNTTLLSAAIKKDGFDLVFTARTKDDENEIRNAVSTAVSKSDVVLISGGSSVGAKDFTERVLSDGEILMHGLAMKPGKPTILAKIDKTLVVGLPGNPYAAYMVYNEIISTVVKEIRGQKEKTLDCFSACNFPSVPGRTTLQLVNVAFDGTRYVATPVFLKSANLITAMSANGYVRISKDDEGIYKDAPLKVIPLEL